MLRILVFPKIETNGFEAQGHVRKFRNRGNEGVEGSLIRRSKSYKLSRIILWSFYTYLFHNFAIRLTQTSQTNKTCGLFRAVPKFL